MFVFRAAIGHNKKHSKGMTPIYCWSSGDRACSRYRFYRSTAQCLMDPLHIWYNHALTLAEAWALLIVGSLCLFVRILWHFIFYQFTLKVFESPLVTALYSTMFHGSCSCLLQLLTRVDVFIMGSLWWFQIILWHFEFFATTNSIKVK